MHLYDIFRLLPAAYSVADSSQRAKAAVLKDATLADLDGAARRPHGESASIPGDRPGRDHGVLPTSRTKPAQGGVGVQKCQ